jgi:hypothetical protein
MAIVREFNNIYSEFRTTKMNDKIAHPRWFMTDSDLQEEAKTTLGKYEKEDERTDLLPEDRESLRKKIATLKLLLFSDTSFDNNKYFQLMNEVEIPSYYLLPETLGALYKKQLAAGNANATEFALGEGDNQFMVQTASQSSYSSSSRFRLNQAYHSGPTRYGGDYKTLNRYFFAEKNKYDYMIITNLREDSNKKVVGGDSLDEVLLSHDFSLENFFDKNAIVSGVLGKSYKSVSLTHLTLKLSHQKSEIANYTFQLFLVPYDEGAISNYLRYETNKIEDLAIYLTSPSCQSELSTFVGPIQK